MSDCVGGALLLWFVIGGICWWWGYRQGRSDGKLLGMIKEMEAKSRREKQ